MRFKKDVKTCILYGLVILLTFVNIKSMFLVTIIFALLLVWQIWHDWNPYSYVYVYGNCNDSNAA